MHIPVEAYHGGIQKGEERENKEGNKENQYEKRENARRKRNEEREERVKIKPKESMENRKIGKETENKGREAKMHPNRGSKRHINSFSALGDETRGAKREGDTRTREGKG